MGARGSLARRCRRIRLRRRRSRRLWPDRARDRGVDSGYRSTMSVQSSLVMYPIHALATPTSGELAARHGARRVHRLLRPHRADGGSDPGVDDDAGREDRGGFRLNGAKMWITNAPIADVFVVWAKSRHDDRSAAFSSSRAEGPLDAEDRGQALPARLDHRRDRARRRRRARGRHAAGRRGPQGAVRLPQQGALRHRLGGDGRGGVLLARRPPLRASRKVFGRPLAATPARAEEARRHADRDRARLEGRWRSAG